MIIVNRKGDSMSGSINGEVFSILFDQSKYDHLKGEAARIELCERTPAGKKVAEKIMVDALEYVTVDYKEQVASVNGYLKYLKNTGKYYLVVDKGTKKELVSSKPLPEILAERIIESFEMDADYMPLLLAWRRCISSKYYSEEYAKLFAHYLTAEYTDSALVAKIMEEEGTTREVAVARATFPDIAISTYGILATYKVVEEVKEIYKFEKDPATGKQVKTKVEAFPSIQEIDEVTGKVTKTPGKPKFLEEVTFKPAIWDGGDDFYCGDKLGYKYKIGETHILPEGAKRELRHTSGGGGLYSGGQSYIEGYNRPGREVLTCLIDPIDIISFQDGGAALRTDRMFITGALTMEGDLSGMYFVSDYAKESNARIEEQFKAVIEAENKEAVKKAAKVAEDSAVIKSIVKS